MPQTTSPLSSNLPTGWVVTTLEDVTIIRDDLRKPVNADERAKRTGPYPYYGATGQVGWIDGYLIDGESILLGEDGAPFLDPSKPKAYKVNGKAWVNNHAHILKSIDNLTDARFLLHSLNVIDYRRFVNGTTRLKLTQASMRQMPINLAPLPEQHRIVAEIERQFSLLDAGVANLKRVQANLKRYRASVLQAACEGRLVPTEATLAQTEGREYEPASMLLSRILVERRARWETEQLAKRGQSKAAKSDPFHVKEGIKPDQLSIDLDSSAVEQLFRKQQVSAGIDSPVGDLLTVNERASGSTEELPLRLFSRQFRYDHTGKSPSGYKEPAAPDTSGLPELPEGWIWASLASLTTNIADVDHKMPKATEEGIPYVSTKDFFGENGINFERAKRISDTDYAALCRKIKPKLGDILLSRYGTVGEIRHVVTEQPFQASYSVAILKTFTPLNVTQYLIHAMRSNVVQAQIKRDVRATAQPDLGLEHIRKFVIGLPPLAEQERIVAEVERCLSVMDNLEQVVKANLKRAERLRQAILKEAFAGRLVAQDPTDEPASVLLERIKAEQEARAEVAKSQVGVKKQRHHEQTNKSLCNLFDPELVV